MKARTCAGGQRADNVQVGAPHKDRIGAQRGGGKAEFFQMRKNRLVNRPLGREVTRRFKRGSRIFRCGKGQCTTQQQDRNNPQDFHWIILITSERRPALR
jgi:hypothetical protein